MDESATSNSQTFSSADRIRQLNEIDKDIAKLVNSAGLAIQALTNAKSTEIMTGNSVNDRKAAFKASTSQYFALLSSIDVRLRRQVYALEEAGILESESATANNVSFKSDSGIGSTTTGGAGAGTAAGTFNPLEVSWLNSRKDTVGKDKEAESWAAAREFLNRGQDTAPKTETMDTDS
ncbi:conserved hypothetical protein [Talaromyces stipitatus ATCC 10500]|uniref:Mediator of RNA polymerase II transcription subunit 11 n=1 Tax=Talaromyces stipitatus (strain ATCC 10500 / CBS 375.48 / QM 6759 / NRRL 1006) TaxID=441959 RepID=B8MHB3_TALSN|nr:uncharacterized protein TSTA_021490 [Talaromyces stipitatus ATCC 10500]EED17092.1 conserved hypothetical protein [Talaromyces stipitatus ATCC 10500]